MSEREVEPLPPEISDLLERERTAYPEDGALKASVLARVEMAVGLMGGGGGGGPDGGGGAGEGGDGGIDPGPGLGGAGGAGLSMGARAVVAIAMGSFVAGGVTGGVVATRATSTSPAPITTVASVAPVAVDASSVEAPPVTSSMSDVADAATSARPVASTAPSAAPRASAEPGDLTREQELLDVARASLARGNAEDAIRAAERHARRWPHGYLIEEREAVWIQALAASGRRDEAEQKTAQFRKNHPNSVLLPAVEAALRASREKSSAP